MQRGLADTPSQPRASQPTVLTRRKVFLGGGIAFLLAGVGGGRTARANELRVGAIAPVATLVTLDGQHISTQELLGSVVVLTFWATWCGPCRQELPLLSEYVKVHARQGLQVLGFCLDGPDTLLDVRSMMVGLRFPVGLLQHSTAPGYGRIWRLPVSFTIDRFGRLVDDGWKDARPAWTRERLDRIVTPLLVS